MLIQRNAWWFYFFIFSLQICSMSSPLCQGTSISLITLATLDGKSRRILFLIYILVSCSYINLKLLLPTVLVLTQVALLQVPEGSANYCGPRSILGKENQNLSSYGKAADTRIFQIFYRQMFSLFSLFNYRLLSLFFPNTCPQLGVPLLLRNLYYPHGVLGIMDRTVRLFLIKELNVPFTQFWSIMSVYPMWEWRSSLGLDWVVLFCFFGWSHVDDKHLICTFGFWLIQAIHITHSVKTGKVPTKFINISLT